MLTKNNQSDIDLYSAINALFGEYADKKTRIGAMKGALDGDAMHYYFEAATARSDHRASYSFGTLFDEAAAIKALDAEFWQATIKMTDVLDHMPAAKRNEWHEQIRKHKTPPFERGIVFDTMKSLIGSRETFLAERVDGIFSNLSHSHITNTPQGFGKRFIMGNMRSYCSVDYRKSEYIHDLRVEISKLHCEVLTAKGFNAVHNQDFLTFSIATKYDRIVMNPPFSEGRAIAHVKHAASLLSKDGILVTVLPAGYRNKLIVEGLKHEWSEVYENEFSGTSIDTVILKLTHQENTQ